jgi:dTDP-4-amino-4,6-dideoxy-D-galactose acyltransferase
MPHKIKISLLPWDSNLFNYKVGMIPLKKTTSQEELEAIAKLAKAEGFKLVYIKSDLELCHINISTGNSQLYLTDKKITYARTVESNPEIVNTPILKLYEEAMPNAELISLALQSGIHSRFAIDSNFQNNEYKKLYNIWIEKSLKKEIANEVWVSQNADKKITGFITIAIKDNFVDIGLLAVDSHERGKNIGKNLIQIALYKASIWGQNKIQVVTQQDNIIACKFYERCGFAPVKKEFIYHLWL